MDRLQEIIESKAFQKIKPISEHQTEKIQRLSSRYMLFTNKDATHGTCECCLKETTFEKKTRHKATVICPSCKKELTVEHVWRKRGCDYNLDWFAQVQAISKDILVMRYFESYQFRSYAKRVSECAREIFDFTTGNRFRVDKINADRTWRESNYYFIEFAGMSWYRRRAFCMAGELLQSKKQIVNEIAKIDAVKYYDYESKLGTYCCLSDDLLGLMSAPLYEKMEKVGLGALAEKDFGRAKIKWKRTETSLVKMLKLDGRRYKVLLNFPNHNVLSFLQRYSRVTDKDLAYLVKENFESLDSYIELRNLKVGKPLKALDYYKKKKAEKAYGFWYEYTHYLGLLKKLKYDMSDLSYICPKDFSKEDKRVSEEYKEMLEAQAREEKEQKDRLIKKISEGLRKMPDIQDFLGGSDGLLVYVPESAEELMAEGRLLHNCIGSYVDRIMEGKTLVFFVRKIEEPNEAFVAFEYVNGEVVQCRYDHNVNVEDTKIINFVDAFAERLRKNNVLYKAA